MSPETSLGSGAHHIAWIGRFQLLLLPVGSLAFLARSKWAALAFLAGGAGSLAFWYAHAFLVGRLLTPSVRWRWFYAVLIMLKLGLLGLYLRAMMGCFPTEVLPLAAGILLFVAAILMEAGRLIVAPAPSDMDSSH